MALGGAFLRVGQTIIRLIQFCVAAIILGIFSYFLAVLSHHHVHIPTWEKAVEGMSGAACLYTLFAVCLTLFLGGIAFFGFIAVFLDLLFAGCFAAIAYYTRGGSHSCSGIVNTPLGSAPSNESAPGAGSYHYVCTLEKACFAVAILGVFLFLVSAVLQVMLVRHHKKEKRYGPSPSNNYTSGAGRRPFWKRNRKVKNTRDAELATAGPIRPSDETHLTGTTMNTGYPAHHTEAKYGQPGYGADTYHNHHATAGTNY